MKPTIRDNSIAWNESMDPVTEKQKFWQKHVLQAQSHNGSFADYAKQQQLKVHTLYYWASIFKRTARPRELVRESVSFSAVRVSAPAPTAHYQLRLSSRLTLEGSALPDPRWLAELSRQLDAPA